MKFTKLSLVAALAVSSAFAGGDIAPVEPVVAAPVVEAATTISGKAQLYYYTQDVFNTNDLFDNANSGLAAAVTLDVSHKLFDGITANFTAVGYTNFGDNIGTYDFEGNPNGAFFNVANITATFGDTTLVLGRQLIDSPMFGSFDWLLAPSSFEAYTIVNKSIDNVTLVGTYVTQLRTVNAGDNWLDLTSLNDGNNYALGAVYGADALSASVWYYNIDAGTYTQVYVDAGYNFGSFSVAGQIASTDFDTAPDSLAYALKAETEVAGFNLLAAISQTSDNGAGIVERDNFYTSSWNTFASTRAVLNDDTFSWKLGASTDFSGLSTEISYAAYGDEGSEFDLILGYDVTDSVNFAAIFSSTDYDVGTNTADADNALELIATYKF